MCVSSYFAPFSDHYHYDPNLPSLKNFRLLSQHMQWYEKNKKGELEPNRRSRRYVKELGKFNQAVLAEASNKLNAALSRLETALALLARYNIHTAKPVKSLTQCKKIIESELFINIYHFIDGKVKLFPNVKKLAEYSHKHGLIFPRQLAKKDLQTKLLLRKFP